MKSFDINSIRLFSVNYRTMLLILQSESVCVYVLDSDEIISNEWIWCCRNLVRMSHYIRI